VKHVFALVSAVLLLAAGLAVLLIVATGRDAPGVHEQAAQKGPGTLLPDHGDGHTTTPARVHEQGGGPPASGPHRAVPVSADRRPLSDDQILHALESGDVVLVYGTPAPPAQLPAIQADVAGPFRPPLARTGQAVILTRRPGIRGVVALAWRRRLVARSAADPRLRDFADYWLGQGAAR
jgi:hypothetical protein